VSANFPTSFIEFGHWMQKLQHFGLDFKIVRILLVLWGVKQVLVNFCRKLNGIGIKLEWFHIFWTFVELVVSV